MDKISAIEGNVIGLLWLKGPASHVTESFTDDLTFQCDRRGSGCCYLRNGIELLLDF